MFQRTRRGGAVGGVDGIVVDPVSCSIVGGVAAMWMAVQLAFLAVWLALLGAYNQLFCVRRCGVRY
jgi:hypothetical protein